MRCNGNVHVVCLIMLIVCYTMQVILRAAAGEVDDLVKKLGKRVHVPVSLYITYND